MRSRTRRSSASRRRRSGISARSGAEPWGPTSTSPRASWDGWRHMRQLPEGSAPLLDADQVARGIAEGAVTNAVRLLGRLLHDLGAGCLHAVEDAVQVGG